MYTYITNRDSPNYTPAPQARSVFGYDRVIEGITIHHWGDVNLNPRFDGVVNFLCRAGGNTSAHFVATGNEGRKVACIVAPGDVSWHTGNSWGNARTIGIECDPRATNEDYDVVAELVADIRSAYGDVPIYWHKHFVATQCPGAWDIERLDKLSYTKYSHATEWGQGGNKSNATPPATPTPLPVPSAPTPTVTYYKLVIDGKQVAAYSSEANAYKGYVEHGSRGSITYDGKAVTKEVVAKFTTPSPTTQQPDGTAQPDSGLPVAEKQGYTDADRQRDTETHSLLKLIWETLKKIFNIGK